MDARKTSQPKIWDFVFSRRFPIAAFADSRCCFFNRYCSPCLAFQAFIRGIVLLLWLCTFSHSHMLLQKASTAWTDTESFTLIIIIIIFIVIVMVDFICKIIQFIFSAGITLRV